MNVKKLIVIVSVLLGANFASAEVFQVAQGENAYMGDGRSAKEAGKLDVQDMGGSTAARVKSNFARWGFVNYWMGIPTPAGNAIIRFRVYNSGEAAAKYMIYIQTSSGHDYVGDLVLPEGAAANEYVDVNIPVSRDNEWSGIVIKKASKDELPSLWIDKVSVVIDE